MSRAVKLAVRKATVNELVTAYAEAAGVHGKAAVVGDYKKANARAEEIASI
jgi:hypothetical protein